MTLLEALNKAAKELPKGWRIEINVEFESGWLSCFDSDGENATEEACSVDETIEEQLVSCIAYANSKVRKS